MIDRVPMIIIVQLHKIGARCLQVPVVFQAQSYVNSPKWKPMADTIAVLNTKLSVYSNQKQAKC